MHRPSSIFLFNIKSAIELLGAKNRPKGVANYHVRNGLYGRDSLSML